MVFFLHLKIKIFVKYLLNKTLNSKLLIADLAKTVKSFDVVKTKIFQCSKSESEQRKSLAEGGQDFYQTAALVSINSTKCPI